MERSFRTRPQNTVCCLVLFDEACPQVICCCYALILWLEKLDNDLALIDESLEIGFVTGKLGQFQSCFNGVRSNGLEGVKSIAFRIVIAAAHDILIFGYLRVSRLRGEFGTRTPPRHLHQESSEFMTLKGLGVMKQTCI